MTNRTITHRDATYSGTLLNGTLAFTSGTATADDATRAGKIAIAFAKRHGWAVSGGIATADDLTPADGESVVRWTLAEKKAYLDGLRIRYPSDATDDDLRKLILDGFDMKAQGGSMANLSAGHLSGTIGPEQTPPVPVPGDDETKAALYSTPLSTNDPSDVKPVVSVAPTAQSVVAPAKATFSVTATGTPTPSVQWQREPGGTGAYVDIPGANSTSYQTPATTVSGGAANNGDKYRAVLSNSDGSVTTSGVALTVTAA